MSKLSEHIYPLGRLGDLVRGFRGVTYKPDDLRTIADEHSAVLLRSNNIQESYLNFEDIQIVPTSIVSEQQVLNKGDIAVCMSNGSRQLVGKSGRYDGSYSNKLTVGAFCSIFRCFCEDDADYVRYLFQSQEYQHSIDILLAGSAINNLKNSDIESILLPIAPKENRAKIAEILGDLDRFIQTVVASIDKLNAIKQGMMTDLFSRGIDPATGKLRPSVQDAPELYNDSPLGPVPKAWSLELLKERLNGHGFIQTGPFGSQLHAYDYVDSGVPVVMPQDLLDGEISTDKISYISPDKAETLSRHKLASNDVIFSRRGDLTRSAFVDSDNGYQGFLCGTGCLLMRVKPEVLCAGWFSNLYGTRLVQAQVDGLAVGTTMANLNSSILGKLLLPFPSVSEQQQIHKRLQAVNSQLKVYISELRKLRAQKAGLMRDLLTGKVPVSA